MFSQEACYSQGSSCASGGYNWEFAATPLTEGAYARRLEQHASRRNCLLHSRLGLSSADHSESFGVHLDNRTEPRLRTNPKPLCHFYFSLERALCKGTHTVASFRRETRYSGSQNGRVEVEIVKVTSIDMYPDA